MDGSDIKKITRRNSSTKKATVRHIKIANTLGVCFDVTISGGQFSCTVEVLKLAPSSSLRLFRGHKS